MASLTEVYEGHVRTAATPRRLYFGASLFAVGTAMVVGSIAVATTGVAAQFGLGLVEARRVAGILAGVGLPAAFLGVFTVLPAGATTRAASVIGASVSVLGVAMFRVAYPEQWFGAGDPLAVATVLVYFAGAVTTLGCLFAGLATFKTRNDPGGTARMEITEEGGVRLVEEAGGVPGSAFGSVGLFGSDPDGDVRTQTNRETPPGPETDDEDDAEILTDGRTRAGGATADGGSAVADDGAFRDAEFLETAQHRGHPDAYCGNCAHFEYVKVDGDITPYCGLHDELMEDMDACREWTEAE
jgi:cytochrome c biogenesis protein CcdA